MVAVGPSAAMKLRAPSLRSSSFVDKRELDGVKVEEGGTQNRGPYISSIMKRSLCGGRDREPKAPSSASFCPSTSLLAAPTQST